MSKVINLSKYKAKHEAPLRGEKVYIPVYDPEGKFAGEHPWVKVIEETPDRLIGILNNELVLGDLHGFRLGDEIEARRVDGLWQVVSRPSICREE
jgi:hypothetical protein